MNRELAERLEAIYAAADAAVAGAGPRCDASGRCCRFREYGHTLFISQIEADYLLQHAPKIGGPVTDAACPYQVENLCKARDWRPLGCRVYFCDPNYQETGAEISERGVRALKVLASELNLGWRYAPLHAFLPLSHSERSEESDSSLDEIGQIPHCARNDNEELCLRDSTSRVSLAVVE
jgi:hypothetical protein